MNHNPEHEQIENKSPQPQVDYALIADRLQDGVQQNIALTSEAGEVDDAEKQATIDATPGLSLLRQLTTQHIIAATRTREGGIYRPKPDILEKERPFVEVMEAQADWQVSLNSYLASGTDNDLRARQQSMDPITTDDIWLAQTELGSMTPAALKAFDLPPNTTRLQFEEFKLQVKSCLQDYLGSLIPGDPSDFHDKQNIPFGDLSAIHKPSDITLELHSLLTERSRIQRTMYGLLTDHFQRLQAKENETKAKDEQADRVDTARELLDDAPESAAPETIKYTDSAIINETVIAAKGYTLINTDMVGGVDLNMSEGSQARRTDVGFQNFGGLANDEAIRLNLLNTFNSASRELSSPPAEAVLFTMATEDITETTTRKVRAGGLGGLFGRKQIVYNTVVTGQKPIEVVNPKTGNAEPGVYLDYHFRPTSEVASEIGYKCSDGRLGNFLHSRILVPESVAGELESELQENPVMIRELIHQLLVQNGGLPEDLWEGTSDKRNYPVRPPYEHLDSNWTIALRPRHHSWIKLPTV